MFILSSKLIRLKDKLKVWNKEVFGNIHNLVSEAEKDLCNIQSQIHITGHSDHLMMQERHAQTNEALLKQEVFWQEKARIRWHMNGDRNSSYFHRFVGGILEVVCYKLYCCRILGGNVTFYTIFPLVDEH